MSVNRFVRDGNGIRRLAVHMSQRQAIGIDDTIAAGNRLKSPWSREAALLHAATISYAGRNGHMGIWPQGWSTRRSPALEPLIPGRIANSTHRTTVSGRLTPCLDRFVIIISVPLCSLGLSDCWCFWASCCPSFIWIRSSERGDASGRALSCVVSLPELRLASAEPSLSLDRTWRANTIRVFIWERARTMEPARRIYVDISSRKLRLATGLQSFRPVRS